MNSPTPDTAFQDDAWVPSSCALCYGSCSLLAHRVEGVVVKLEGNPQSVVGKGRLCGKGVSGLASHYDPNRLLYPLRRTNPKKGLGEDPGWKRIGWDEALEEIAAVLARVRAEDPRKLLMQRTTTVTASRIPFQAFGTAFGTPNVSTSGGGLHCGNGAHLISGLMHGSWGIVPDFKYCNYAIYFGASKGHGAGHASNPNMGLAADSRSRGMKMVVVDPMANFAAAKATEWVPIRVGTDAALALAMCHVIVHELGTLDLPYLKAKTNAPYLIGRNKLYVRDPQSGAPLLWDTKRNEARPCQEVDPDDAALEGTFQFQGSVCEPAFKLLRAHLKSMTPEWAQPICTVPAADIRRIAKEFATEARIGSTVVIDGVTLPYRPAAAIAFRGNQGHMNSAYNFLAVDLLNHLVGAADVVGGCLGFNPASHGFPATGRPHYLPSAGPDGLLSVGMWMGYHYPYPPAKPRMPQKMGLQDLFTIGMTSPFLDSLDQESFWKTFELPYRPEVLINFGSNLLLSIANRETVAHSLARYKFMVCFDLYLTETSAFADIVLPDCSYLQSLDSRANFPFILAHPAGMDTWSWPIRQPVVAPEGEQRAFADVLLEIADRVGFRAELNAQYNRALSLADGYELVADRPYTYEEICDRDLKCCFGAERGLEWFREHGLVSWPKKPEEVYWRAFVDARVPIYWEFLLPIYDDIAAIAEPRGVKVPREYYEPLPSFLPCPSHCCNKPGFDLYAFYYRDIIHTNSYTLENPLLDEAAQLDPYSYAVAINDQVARAKGLANGQLVWVETETGRRVKGRVRLSQAIHPEGLGIAACAGHTGDGMPIAKGKGVAFNDLLELDWDHVSPINLSLDLCVRVKVSPVESPA